MNIEKAAAVSKFLLNLACENWRKGDKALFVSIVGNSLARHEGGGIAALAMTALREKFATIQEIDAWFAEIKKMEAIERYQLANTGNNVMIEELKKSGDTETIASVCDCAECRKAREQGAEKTLGVPNAFVPTSEHDEKNEIREVLSEIVEEIINAKKPEREYDPEKLH